MDKKVRRLEHAIARTGQGPQRKTCRKEKKKMISKSRIGRQIPGILIGEKQPNRTQEKRSEKTTRGKKKSKSKNATESNQKRRKIATNEDRTWNQTSSKITPNKERSSA